MKITLPFGKWREKFKKWWNKNEASELPSQADLLRMYLLADGIDCLDPTPRSQYAQKERRIRINPRTGWNRQKNLTKNDIEGVQCGI